MTRRTIEIGSLEELAAHLADTRARTGHASLVGCMVVDLDLREQSGALAEADVRGAVLLGCTCADGVEEMLQARGALVFPTLPDLPFDPYRARLYDAEELFGEGPYSASADGLIYAWSRAWRASRDVRGSLAAMLHDDAISTALDAATAAMDPSRVVGVMGGHDVDRDSPNFAAAARLGRDLARAGYLVLTGGGPGAMEAANLGAYLAPFDDEELDLALAQLSIAPSPAGGIDAWVDAARQVRRNAPPVHAGRSVGIPTWFYGHEPPNLFATDVAKYFLNSLREDTLLHRCRGGIVFLPGEAGTVQEIFQATTENYYASQSSLVAPLVLVDSALWDTALPAYPLLESLGRGRVMGERLALVPDVASVLPALEAKSVPQ